MTKDEFLNMLEEVLEVEQLTETTPVELSSMQTLGIIIFVDENFGKQLKTNDIINMQSVSDLISLIGINFDEKCE